MMVNAIDNTNRFNLPASVKLDSSGNGQVRFAPAGEDWQIISIAVTVSTRNLEPIANVYSPFIGGQYNLDSTYSGGGDTTDSVFYVNDGTPIYVAWTGGDPNATATAVVTYFRSAKSGGFRAV